MASQRFGILARGSLGALHRFGAGWPVSMGGCQEYQKGDQSGGSVGIQAWLIFTVYFLEVMMGPADGCHVGLQERAVQRGAPGCQLGKLCSCCLLIGQNSKFEKSRGDQHLRGSWINESGVEGQGMGWIWELGMGEVR